MAKKRSRVPGTSRDTRRPLKAEPPSSAAIRSEQKKIERQIADGDHSFRDVYNISVAEINEFDRLDSIERTWLKRRRDEPPEKSPRSVGMIASRMTVGRVLKAMPTVDAETADLVLSEYDFDPKWRLDEIGTAEADLIDSAIRLATRTPR